MGSHFIPEYGNALNDPDHFRFLYAYSPLHNIKPGLRYPAVLVLAAKNDERVSPAHSMKFIASLQEHSIGDRPCLLHMTEKGGHGEGKSNAQQLDEWSTCYAFLFKELGIKI
jgi:prolyl oligopeptidase